MHLDWAFVSADYRRFHASLRRNLLSTDTDQDEWQLKLASHCPCSPDGIDEMIRFYEPSHQNIMVLVRLLNSGKSLGEKAFTKSQFVSGTGLFIVYTYRECTTYKVAN